MKRMPFKMGNNRSKLQINRPSAQQMVQAAVKNRGFKQNLHILTELQKKEENSNYQHRFPSIRRISNSRRTSVKSQFEESPPSTKKASLPKPQSRQRLHRASSTYDSKICQQQAANSTTILNHAVTDFIKLLQGKKILQISPTNSVISSQNIRVILLYIITTKTQFLKNQAFFLADLNNENILDDFLREHWEGSCPLPPRRRILGLCSKAIQVQGGKGVNGEMVKELAQVVSALGREVTELEGRKQLLEDEIKSASHASRQNQRRNLTLQLSIESSRAELQGLLQALQSNKSLLLESKSKKSEIENFVNVQSNLIAKEAAEYHKNLELDLFQYADFLKHHPLGRKEFEPSIFYNEIERLQEVEAKHIVASLHQERSQEKEGSFRDFLKRFRHQYRLMIDELTRAIAEKTKYIQKFTEFMHRWYENYLAKKEYLSGLAEAFSLEAVTLQHLRQGIEAYCDEENKLSTPSPACFATLKKIFAGVQKLVEIFGLGNSFY